MDKSITSFVGIDIAKHTLDLHVRPDGRQLATTNDPQGFKAIIDLLPKPKTCLVVVEATGGYQRSLVDALLNAGHHDVELSRDEMRRVKCWIDLNCPLWPDYIERSKRQQPVAAASK